MGGRGVAGSLLQQRAREAHRLRRARAAVHAAAQSPRGRRAPRRARCRQPTAGPCRARRACAAERRGRATPRVRTEPRPPPSPPPTRPSGQQRPPRTRAPPPRAPTPPPASARQRARPGRAGPTPRPPPRCRRRRGPSPAAPRRSALAAPRRPRPLPLRPLDARLSIGGRAADVPCEQQRPRAEITPREARGGRGRGASNDDPARNPPRSARAASATAAEPKRHVESHSGEQAARRAVGRRTAPEGCMEEMLERGRGIAARGARAKAGGASSAGAPVRVGK